MLCVPESLISFKTDLHRSELVMVGIDYRLRVLV